VAGLFFTMPRPAAPLDRDSLPARRLAVARHPAAFTAPAAIAPPTKHPPPESTHCQPICPRIFRAYNWMLGISAQQILVKASEFPSRKPARNCDPACRKNSKPNRRRVIRLVAFPRTERQAERRLALPGVRLASRRFRCHHAGNGSRRPPNELRPSPLRAGGTWRGGREPSTSCRPKSSRRCLPADLVVNVAHVPGSDQTRGD